MNLEEFEKTPVFVLRGLLMALAVVWMLLPEQAVAFSNSFSNSGEAPLVPFSGCADLGWMDAPAMSVRPKQTLAVAFSSATEVRAAFTPCEDEDLDRDADPQYNICFEGNPAPISTLPHLLAGLQAEHASSLVLGTAAGFLETKASKRRSVAVENRIKSVASVLGALQHHRPPVDRGVTCSGGGDHQCSALPGLPGSIELASGVSVMLPESLEPDLSSAFPNTTDLKQHKLWARLRVGPAVGHGLRPDRPPIGVASGFMNNFVIYN